MSGRPGNGLPNAVDSTESLESPTSPDYPTPSEHRAPLLDQQQPPGQAKQTQPSRHLPPIVRASDGSREDGNGGDGSNHSKNAAENKHESQDEEHQAPHAAKLLMTKKANSDEDRRQDLIHKLRLKAAQLGPNEYGVTPEDLSRICNFDNRSSPSLLQMYNNEFGGIEGLAVLLKVDLEKGLERVDEGVDVDTHGKKETKKSRKQQVAPEMGDDGVPLPMKRNMTAVENESRQAAFGTNVIPPPRSDTILEMVWETIKEDPIIKVLIIGAAVVLALGTAICPSEGYIEGLAILVAVVIVLSVTAGNDWSKDRKFKKLLLLQSDKRCKVIRGGVKDQVSSWDLIVGDLVEVVVGDEIPADGLFVNGNRLVVDESPLTGESIPVKKNPSSPYMFSGCQVSEGSGVMLVTGVGTRSSGGQIQELLNEAQNEETVLQAKLHQVAVLIGKVGVASGILTFLALLVRWAIAWGRHEASGSGSSCSGSSDSETLGRIQAIAEDFVIGITVVVVAVPEGLPLAVTISLAFSMFKMIKDNCFVRHLDASETMGEATCICTDKTGTLTENRMTVVKALVGDQIHYGEGSGEDATKVHPFSPTTLQPHVRDIFTEGICVNSNCFVKMTDKGQPLFVGSATEGALLVFSEKLGVHYDFVRKQVAKVENGTWSFSSDRKRMSTLVQPMVGAIPMEGSRDNGGDGESSGQGSPKYRLYTKGASEIVLSLCTHIIDAQGTKASRISADDISRIQRTIKRWASQGLRTLALSYRDTDKELMTFESSSRKDDPEHDLVFIGLVGIKDPLRKEVPGAVAICQRAGLTIRMVTGDNILTACKIARESNIMFGEGIALEGPVFRAMSLEEKMAIIPRLQVLARSSPSDKHTLVNLLKRMGEVVAVTGDGTNDAPALKEADVGFAMGISGTQIAMNASDIVLLDDNFVSLVQSIRWGRNVLNCVRKFLQFQLGVNLVAIILTFVGSLTQGSSPLSTVQLLWVNLIMDSLGALALASDEPEDDILDHPPHARTASLLSRPMRQYIVIQVLFQIIVLLLLFLGGADHWVPYDESFYHPADVTGDPSRRASTMVFLVFILMQLSNIVMARQLNGELNVFKDFFRNKLFILIITVILAVQVLVIFVAGSFVRTCRLNWPDWVVCIILALCNFPFTMFLRAMCNFHENNRGKAKWHWSFVAHDVNRHKKVASTTLAPAPQATVDIDGSSDSVTEAEARPVAKGPAGTTTEANQSQTHVPHHQPQRRAGTRWQTVRSAVVLMGALETVRHEDFTPRGPDPGFLEHWIRFRKDVGAVLPTKGAAIARSSGSLHQR